MTGESPEEDDPAEPAEAADSDPPELNEVADGDTSEPAESADSDTSKPAEASDADAAAAMDRDAADAPDGGAAEDTDERPSRSPETTALLLDAMLGKLATYLRMCGYDATYAGERGIDTDDRALALAHTEGRTVLTRDVDLASQADPSVLLTTREVTDQLRELRAAGFELDLADEPVRCSACNGPLERVDRTEPTPEYAPDTHEETVWRCRNCGQHFWKGSHWDDVADTLDELS